MLSSTSRFQTTASGRSQDSRSYDNMSSNTTSSSFVSDDEVRYFKQTIVQFRFSNVPGKWLGWPFVRLQADCPVFQSPVRRPAQHQAGCGFVLLFETPPPVIRPPTGHRSGVCYDNPFSSQLVIYRRFVTPLDVWYWRNRYSPASVWNDLGSHKPVCGGKRRAESTPFALVVMVRVMVRVSVMYHRDRVIIGVNGRCRLCSCLTNANGFMRTQIGAHLPTPPPLLPSAVGPRHAPTQHLLSDVLSYWLPANVAGRLTVSPANHKIYTHLACANLMPWL